MSEDEWLRSNDPAAMLRFLHGGVLGVIDDLAVEERTALRQLLKSRSFDRKLGMVACAFGRFIFPAMKDERSQRAVEMTERFWDGGTDDRSEAFSIALAARNEPVSRQRDGSDDNHVYRVAADVAFKARAVARCARTALT